MLASGADDLRIWDGDKYDMLTKHYSPPVQKISSLAWNSTNAHVACLAPGGCTIDITSVQSTDDPIGYPIIDEATCLCWHNSSRYIGVGCADGAVKVYDLKTQRSKKSYTGHKDAVTSITYNYSDTTLASASKSGEITLHNTITGLTTRMMTALKLQAIQAIQFSPYHHSMLASVSDDASLVLWDANARRSVHQFTRSHKAPATDLSFSPSNDRLLLSCGLDKNIVLYDVLNKSIVRTLQVDAPLSSITMHANGYQVASGTIRGHVLLHDLRHGSKVQHSFIAHRTSVQCLAFHNRVIPKKSRGSHSTISQSSVSSLDSEHKEISQTRQTPLSPVDQNIAFAPTQRGDMVDSKPITPRNNRLPSGGSVSSIFSPELAENGGHSPVGSQLSAEKANSSRDPMPKVTADSLFSPEVEKHAPVRNGADISSSSESSQNGWDKPDGTAIKSLPAASAVKRALPTPPTSARGSAPTDRPSPRSTRPAPSSASAAQFSQTTKGLALSSNSDSSSGAPSVAGGADVDDPLTTRLKEELKQQLKSELVSEIRDMMESLSDELKRTIIDHHFEMIKQFHLTQVHVEAQTSMHSLNHNLVRENEELRAEIERLKRTY